MIQKFKPLFNKTRIIWLRIFASNEFTSGLYYLLFSGAFRREHQAVLKGRLRYYDRVIVKNDANYLLRRNIHRLEKGLIMKNRRRVFALEYIEETVKAYLLVTQNLDQFPVSQANLKWYKDVLLDYFKAVDTENYIVKKALQTFSPISRSEQEEIRSIPYARNFDLLEVSYESFLNLTKLRRAVRWYEDRPVPIELIDKAIRAASLSPSACNRQPFEFRVYNDPKWVQKVSNITWGTRGFNENFPCIIVLTGMLDAYFNERDRHVVYIDASLAAMSFMLALETLGLSSCPINWPDVGEFEKKIRTILDIGLHERPIMLISCGYPDKQALVPFSEKKDLDEVRSYNKP